VFWVLLPVHRLGQVAQQPQDPVSACANLYVSCLYLTSVYVEAKESRSLRSVRRWQWILRDLSWRWPNH